MPRGRHPNSLKALEEHRKKTQFTRETAVEAQQRAAEAVVRRRTFKEEFELELATMVRDSKTGTMQSVKNAITKTTVQKALKGDLRAIEFIRDTIGEKPMETVELVSADFSTLDKIRDELENDS